MSRYLGRIEILGEYLNKIQAMKFLGEQFPYAKFVDFGHSTKGFDGLTWIHAEHPNFDVVKDGEQPPLELCVRRNKP